MLPALQVCEAAAPRLVRNISFVGELGKVMAIAQFSLVLAEFADSNWHAHLTDMTMSQFSKLF
jgi:hypothetical protein